MLLPLRAILDLIDTLWNVKSGNSVTGQALNADLIDTLWNVKSRVTMSFLALSWI